MSIDTSKPTAQDTSLPSEAGGEVRPPADRPKPASREVKNIAGIQGVPTGADGGESNDNSAQKGSRFETWARQEVFNGKGARLAVRPEDNPQLDKLGDGVGITKDRRVTDVYLDDEGAIWELKSGYEKGRIDQDQLFEYSLMEQAGHVNVREGDEIKKVKVTSVNYLFETQAAAHANEPYLRGLATPWYVDNAGQVQLLEDYEKK